MIVSCDLISAAATAAATGGAEFNTATIVGLWSIQFISQGNTAHNPPIPDGAQIDFGYTQWHSDGTELMNSGGHAPATGNFCMGTWVRSGFFTYVLNHFALSYDASNGDLTGKVTTNVMVRAFVGVIPGGLGRYLDDGMGDIQSGSVGGAKSVIWV